MSLPHQLAHEHEHDDGHHDDGIPHASMRDYVVGFVLSVLLTAIPFALVMGEVALGTPVLVAVILACAAAQVVVQMVYFLHMKPKSEGGWNLLALVFTGVLVVIVLAGSLWVMHHMNTNMMPSGHEHAAQAAAQSM
ncbi:cytochrome o ubiquinol oxidase subunit IV [Tolypothrix campylonemoides VB511288]|nr:cytochrome o ubiquinol oxidase subunit IV [Tolypothrix campylonemoides VB511288]